MTTMGLVVVKDSRVNDAVRERVEVSSRVREHEPASAKEDGSSPAVIPDDDGTSFPPDSALEVLAASNVVKEEFEEVVALREGRERGRGQRRSSVGDSSVDTGLCSNSPPPSYSLLFYE